jgi:hypothetical protein
MGFFGDIHKLSKQAKEIDKNWDAGAQARDGIERMRAANAQMEQMTQAMTDGMPASAQVVSVGATTGMLNMDPILPIELLVQQDGAPPRPVTVTAAVPMAFLYRAQPGATLPVRVSASDPSSVAIDWMAPTP